MPHKLPLRPRLVFEVFYLDGFSWVDFVDFMRVPHYTNGHRLGNKPTKHFRQRRIERPDPYTEGETEQVDLLVVWSGATEPTDAAILKQLAKDD